MHFCAEKELRIADFFFQQDSDPKYTSKFYQNYIAAKEKQKKCLLSHLFERNVRKMQPTNQKHLRVLIQTCWNQIYNESLQKLIVRMHRVCAAVIKANGGYFEESKIKKKILKGFL